MVVIDTSVIIDHIRQHGKNSVLDKFSNKSKDNFTIALITVQEIFEGKSTIDEEVENELLELIDSLEVLPYTFETAKLAGEIARGLSRSDFADAAIAATAILNKAKLFTLNKKDFQGIKGLKLI